MAALETYETDVSDMYAVHKALLGAFDSAPNCVAKAGLDAERVEIVGSFCENVIEFLHVHHTGEDELIYPVLEKRCAGSRSSSSGSTTNTSCWMHRWMLGGPLLRPGARRPSTDNAQAVIDAIASIAEPLRPHLAEEETVLLPIASKWMSQEEFGMLPAHHMMSFRADKPWLMMGLVREQLDQEHRDGMLAGMPPEMRTMWTEQMEPAFNAFVAEVRR